MVSGVPVTQVDSLSDLFVAFGRELLERIHRPVFTTGRRLASTILPAGNARLLLFGLPLPVFAYRGDGDEELNLLAMERLRRIQAALPDGKRLAFQSFGPCFGEDVQARCLALLTRLRPERPAGRSPVLLGLELVTVYPISRDEAARWPVGPPELLDVAQQLEGLAPSLYRLLGRLLVAPWARPMGRSSPRQELT